VSALRARAGDYLAMRRALGFKLESHGPRLMSFVRFCEDRGATAVTTDLAVEWATSTASDHEAYQGRRLDVVRIFARHMQAREDILAFTAFPARSGGRSGPATRYLLTGSRATRSWLPPEVHRFGKGGVDAAG
jgi:hypothetical protein